jgi:hypothetical protein
MKGNPGVPVNSDFAFAFWYPSRMYTEEDLISLIPDKWRNYRLTRNGSSSADDFFVVESIDTVGNLFELIAEGRFTCVHCGTRTTKVLTTSKLHPLLGTLVAWYTDTLPNPNKERLPSAPPFCTTKCLRKFIVLKQGEFLLFLTS